MQPQLDIPPQVRKELRPHIEVELARRDFWEFAKHIKTEDNETSTVHEFPVHFEYLHKAKKFTDENQFPVIHKARRLLITTLEALDMLWEAWRCDAKAGQSYFGAIVSKGERESFEVMDRAQFMFSTLPEHFKTTNSMHFTKSTLEFDGGGKIMSLPAAEDIGRTFGFTDVLLDEMAFLPFDRAMWRALRPTAKKLRCVSTANGMHNLFAMLWHDKEKFDVGRLFLHWSERPNREEWADQMKATMLESDWMRELEGSFDVLAGERVYPEFSKAVHVAEAVFKPSKELIVYRGWDFGYHSPAVIWKIKNKRDQIHAVHEFIGDGIDTYELCERVIEISNAKFPHCQFIDWCDPAGHQKQSAAKSERSDVAVLESHGIFPRSKTRRIKEGVDLTRQMLKLRVGDGRPGILVDPSCEMLIAAYMGGYHYPEQKPGKPKDENPEKDGTYDHIADADRYSTTGIMDNMRLKIVGAPKVETMGEDERYKYVDPVIGV